MGEQRKYAILFAATILATKKLHVRREEGSLEARFGESYVAYKKSVPRWLGRSHRN